MMKNFQKAGGLAALIHAIAYVVSIVLGAVLLFPVLGAGPSQYLAFVASNQALVYIWNLNGYWVTAIALVVLALALYDRLKAGSPALAQTATVFGLVWAGLIIGSANLMLRDVGVMANLYGKDPAQAATAWLTLEAVENGIVSGNEVVGGLWVLLLSLAALRTGGLDKALSCLGLALGVVGILTIIPAFNNLYIFGPGMIVWCVWLGIVMLRSRPNAAA
jgi:hypothetical protein